MVFGNKSQKNGKWKKRCCLSISQGRREGWGGGGSRDVGSLPVGESLDLRAKDQLSGLTEAQ